MARLPKPPEGSWTEHYPELGTDLIDYEDSISPEFYDLEREAIFKRAWLNVGRVEQLPRDGSYFTKEIQIANTSIVVARDQSGDVRAFYNVCRHRGNKLVWTDYPDDEVAGTARQFVCKFHGWKYDLDGTCAFVQQEGEFFDFDKADYSLVPVHCDVWNGFIFVNLDREPRQPLREYLGPMITALDGYPFDQLSEHYAFRAEVKANWKIFLDVAHEFYHAPVLHARQAPAAFSEPAIKAGFEAPHYQIDGSHNLVCTSGLRADKMPTEWLKPMERLTRSGLFGPWDGFDLGELPAGVNPASISPWGLSSFHVWPNLLILIWERGWVQVYNYWPTSYNAHVYEGWLLLPPAHDARLRVANEMAAVTFKEYLLQDANTLEATQKTLESRIVERFPINDQEVLVRHLHKVAAAWVDDYQREIAAV